MPDQTIICPYCKKEIPLTETLSHQIRENVRKELEAAAQEKENAFILREKQLAEKQKEINAEKEMIDQRVKKLLKAEEMKFKEAAKAEAVSSLQVEMKDLKSQIETKDQALRKAQENELSLRKKARELEDRQKNLELEVARAIDSEKNNIMQQALAKFTQDHRFKDMEKDKMIDDMRKTIGELKRKAEQGSMQAQGEVLELDLEALLKARFPFDSIVPVSKGARGADIQQRVVTSIGQFCGTILWETKRTKTWSDSWISKLKEDQRETNAEIAVIVSEALPRGLNSFAQIDGVWVTSITLAGSLAEVLRSLLIEVSQTVLSSANKGEKKELLYNYLSGPAFRQRVGAILEAFTAMKGDLDKEKRAMLKIWSKREKQIEKVINNTAGMYGDMQGIIGSSLPEIKMLELDSECDDNESQHTEN